MDDDAGDAAKGEAEEQHPNSVHSVRSIIWRVTSLDDAPSVSLDGIVELGRRTVGSPANIEPHGALLRLWRRLWRHLAAGGESR